MKKLYIFIALAVGMLLSAACDNYDDLYEEQYASVLRLKAFGETDVYLFKTDADNLLSIDVLRSGNDINRSVSGTVSIMPQEDWVKYAATYGMQRYNTIPEDCYYFGNTPGAHSSTVSFAPKQIAALTTIQMNYAKIKEFYDNLEPAQGAGTGGEKVMCIPIILTSDNTSVFEEQQILILKPQL